MIFSLVYMKKYEVLLNIIDNISHFYLDTIYILEPFYVLYHQK